MCIILHVNYILFNVNTESYSLLSSPLQMLVSKYINWAIYKSIYNLQFSVKVSFHFNELFECQIFSLIPYNSNFRFFRKMSYATLWERPWERRQSRNSKSELLAKNSAASCSTLSENCSLWNAVTNT